MDYLSPGGRLGRLARLGDGMVVHRRAILGVQWVTVVFYLALVSMPAFLPQSQSEARLFSNVVGSVNTIDWHDRMVLLAQYIFWGVWWPFVILSIMLMGRVWCGVFCPEGTLTELASRVGRSGSIPKRLRWSGWPLVAFILTTVYGQLISVYDYPQATFLILGGSTVAAVIVGWLYGRSTRVWCRYLCPVSGVFALLARIAPIHFRVDRATWDAYRGVAPLSAAIACAPLLDVKHMTGAAQCHACGRCSGHRDAVTLAIRSPNAEILAGQPPAQAEVLLLIFGVFGVALGAFQWTINPWFVQGKQATAAWLVNHDILWPLADSPVWWLLTRYPEANDVFTWLVGMAILTYIGAVALLLGGGIFLAVRGAAKLAGIDWRRLALGLIPLGGIGLLLGLSMMTVSRLRAEGAVLPWLNILRGSVLGFGMLWSAWLGWRLLHTESINTARLMMPLRSGLSLKTTRAKPLRIAAAFMLWLTSLSAVGTAWGLMFYIW